MGTVAGHQLSSFSSPSNGDTPIDATIVKGNDNTTGTAHNAHDADATIHLQNGVVSGRPSAGTAGTMWLASDTGALFLTYDTGSAWVDISYLKSTGGTVGDGTALSSNNQTAANVLGQIISIASANASGNYDGFNTQIKQTVADTIGTVRGIHGYAMASHTSGSLGSLVGVFGVCEAAGSGGTTSVLRGLFGSTTVASGATVSQAAAIQASVVTNAGTVTSSYGLLIGDGSGAGTTTTQYGINIAAMTKGSVNWSLYCAGGGVTFRDSALATSATTGHLFIPSCAGTPTGVPTTIPTGQVALQYDSTNNIIYVYNGAWKATAALT